jgi:hypothetical protein
MKAIKIMFAAAIAALSIFATGCSHQGKPHKRGELLNTEQIKALANDQSMNGKVVTIEGYAGICGSMFVTAGKNNNMDIYTDNYCEGTKLITAKIKIDNGSVPIGGEAYRNYAEVSGNFENKTIKFMTDDYQELANGKLKFSGTIIYDGSNYYLDNVIIYQ